MRAYFRIQVLGLEHLSPQAQILAPKHSSRWDPLVLALLCPRPMRYVAARSEFRGLQGWLIRRLGAIAIDREEPRASSFRQIEALLQAGQTLVWFPEGGIRPHGLGALKPGLGRLVVRLARRQPIAVVPVSICYRPAAIWRAEAHVQVLAPLWVQPDPTLSHAQERQVANQFTQQLTGALAAALQASKG